MIAYLKGKIQNKGRGYIILLVGNVGYQVFVSAARYVELDINQEAEMYVHEHIKEDAQDLYGFNSMAELEMFELLLSISGVGPKSALNTLSIASLDDLKTTIAQGDPSLLIKVSGIGRKTAERIVLELKDKVGILTYGSPSAESSVNIASDEIDALMALGYTLQQARDALKQVDPKITESGERIRAVLKSIGK
ncbi:MAG: Holliday junction ATP-dependent DNA helicase RuvA [Parcubacteria group bacterium ADurb.Bin316]|nr:MAG: Holliday junction ATP-dependent DNA helicase RuvA [Parcubacteria group bacterium ADurb.Bin316]HOZ56165.1 Holliday junction branch migration protein RuvA [bacterium]